MSFLPIPLSSGYITSVKQGDSVTIGQILAKKDILSEISIPLAKELGVPIKAVAKHLIKNPGETITSGDILAKKKNVFGATTAQVVTKISGKISRFERETGELFIHIDVNKADESDTIISPIEGTILVCNNEKIVIQTDKGVMLGSKGAGDQITAPLYCIEDKETVEPYYIQTEAIGAVIAGNYFPKEVLVKSASMGVKGIIGTKILDSDIYFLAEKKLALPIIEVINEDLKKILQWNGKNVFINGETKTIILLHA
jgi:hypothetical protein